MKIPKNRKLRPSRPSAHFAACFFALITAGLILSSSTSSQDLPDKIRGYKVHSANISVVNARDRTTPPTSSEALVRLGEPQISVGLFGATIDIGAEIKTAGRSGQIEFLSFHNFRIEGVPVEIEEYTRSFSLGKDQAVTLPQPIRGNLSVVNFPGAIFQELFDSSDDLRLTGTVLAFGKFKKLGFSFKRVIPIKIDLRIENPLH